MSVTYDKAMREIALRDRRGLITIGVVNIGKNAGKFGWKMTVQGPADAEEIKMVTDFITRFAELRGSKRLANAEKNK